MVGIRPDVVPDERFVPGPLPLLSEGVVLWLYIIDDSPPLGAFERIYTRGIPLSKNIFIGAMSFFTLIYVGPILGLIYYLFFWRTRTEKSHCVLQQQRGNENYQILLNTAV